MSKSDKKYKRTLNEFAKNTLSLFLLGEVQIKQRVFVNGSMSEVLFTNGGSTQGYVLTCCIQRAVGQIKKAVIWLNSLLMKHGSVLLIFVDWCDENSL